MLTSIEITVAGRRLVARLEQERAPQTCSAFESLLPLDGKLLHVRWCGDGIWIPLTDPPNIDLENHTAHPAPGDVVFDLGRHKSPEILVPYGPASLASKAGPLSANHFATIEDGREHLRELGLKTLWEGAQDVSVRAL